MSQTNQHPEAFDDDSGQEYDDDVEESGSTEESDDPDELIDDCLADILSDTLDDNWEAEEVESENDFYNELRERYEDEETL